MPELGVTRSQWPGGAAVTVFPARSSAATGPAGEALATEAGSTDLLTAVNALATLLTATNLKLDAIVTALGTANGHLATIETNTTPP